MNRLKKAIGALIGDNPNDLTERLTPDERIDRTTGSHTARTLHEAIQANGGKTAPALLKYLNECRLNDWQDLTKANLNDFRDTVTERVAQSTARTYFAVFKTILRRYEDEGLGFCPDYRDILAAKNVKPVKTFLTTREVERLERVETRSGVERLVLDEFLIGAYTGMRISDVRNVSRENVADGYLSYTSIKTGIHAVIPIKPGMPERIARVQANDPGVSLMGYNKALRRLCKRAGVAERVTVYKAGKSIKGEKWEFVSSHTARISFATNLSLLGVPIIDISRLMGHASTSQTERYIVPTQVSLNDNALRYFG